MLNESLFNSNTTHQNTRAIQASAISHGYNEPLRSGSVEIYKHPTKPDIFLDHATHTVSIDGNTHSLHNLSPNVIEDAIDTKHRESELNTAISSDNPTQIHSLAKSADYNIKQATPLINSILKKSIMDSDDIEHLKRFKSIRSHSKEVLEHISLNKHATSASLDLAAHHGVTVTHRTKANPETIHSQVVSEIKSGSIGNAVNGAISNINTNKETLQHIADNVPHLQAKVSQHPTMAW